MFLSWRHLWKKRNASKVRARCQSKPSLEALEDRCVLSTATTRVPLDHLAGIAATTSAGVPFTGQIATFEARSVTGLAATIDWGDGHITAATIAPLANQVDQISGTNTFAAPGNYSVIITITGPQDTAATVQTTVVVLPENQALALHGGTSIASPLVIFVDNVPTNVLTVQAGGTIVAQNAPVQPIYVQVQIYGPVRLSADQISWERTHEHGLDGVANVAGQSPVPSDGNHLEVLARGADSALQLNVEVASQMTPFAVVISHTPAARAFANLLVFGEVAVGGGSLGATFTVEAAPRPTDLPLEQSAPIADTAAYQVPLFRVAERSELGNLGASTALTASQLHKNNACTLTVMAPAVPPAQLEAQDIAARAQAIVHPLSHAGVGGWSVTLCSILEVATAWLVFNVLHSTVFPRMPMSAPALPSKLAAPPRWAGEPDPVS